MQVEVYTFIFKQLNAYKLGVPIGYRLRKNRLGLTWFLGTSNGKLENEARHERAILSLQSDDTEKWKKSWSQYSSNNNSLHEHSVGVSYA